MNGSSFFKEIGRSFIVSSLLPASVFLTFLGIIFRGFIPNSLVEILIGEKSTILGIAIVGMIALWLAYLLYSGHDSVFKLFEGYYYSAWYKKILIKIQAYKFQKNYKVIDEFLEKETDESIDDSELEESYLFARAMMQDLELSMPLDEDNILPTKLGNILRASEIYPYSRYGIDSLTLWPRMIKFLPKDMMDELEAVNNDLVFMLNSSLLSYILTLASILILIVNSVACMHGTLDTYICQSTEWGNGITYTPKWLFVVIAIACWVGGNLFYRLGTNVAIEYGMYVRTTFDLYRHTFLEHMTETIPQDIEKEKETWKDFGDFYIFGNEFGSREFQIEKAKKDPPIVPLHQLFLVGLLLGFICRILSIRKHKRVRMT